MESLGFLRMAAGDTVFRARIAIETDREIWEVSNRPSGLLELPFRGLDKCWSRLDGRVTIMLLELPGRETMLLLLLLLKALSPISQRSR